MFFDEFSSLLKCVCIIPGNFVITGDFNIHFDNSNDSANRKLNDLLDVFNLKQHVSSSTHRGGHTLDLIITRNDDYSIMNVSTTDPGISDHFALMFNLDASKPPLPEQEVCFRKLRLLQFNL